MDYGDGYTYGGGEMGNGNSGANNYNRNNQYGGMDGSITSTSYTGTGGSGTPSKQSFSKSITPIVASMIGKKITEQDSSFRLFDQEIHSVVICGIISSYKDGVHGSRDFVIHDSTGVIQCRQYTSSEDSYSDIREGYVKAIGVMKTYNDSTSLNIHHIVPVVNMDEIIEHYMSVITCFLYYKKKADGISPTSTSVNAYDVNNSGMSGMNSGMELTDLESKIHNLIMMNKEQNGQGLSMDSLIMSLGRQGVTKEEVIFTVNNMANNMTIYESNPGVFTA